MLDIKPTLRYYNITDLNYSTEDEYKAFLTRIKSLVKNSGYNYSIKELKDILLEDGFILYGTLHNKLISAMIVLFDPCINNNYIIDTLIVSTKYRNKGIGRFMINYLIDLAKDKKISDISLLVRNSNPARNLYKSIGFEITPVKYNKDNIIVKTGYKLYTEMKLKIRNR